MGAQFTVLDSQLTKPMGDVSGFWLTWYYFGYSPIYSALVAWTQILAAVLLCFRRTTLIGALVLFPVMINIVCIDIWVVQFPVDSGALRNALIVLTAVTAILTFHGKDLYRFLLQGTTKFAIWARGPIWLASVQCAVVAGMVVYTAHEGYWLANVNNRDPTAIDGAWQVVQSVPSKPDLPDWIYFEYNRAYMAVFHFPDGREERHDFRVDEQKKKLTMSSEWLTPQSDLFSGTWERAEDKMNVRGIWADHSVIDLTLQRKQMHIKDHR